MAFKLKSGNNTSFKMMGSSPIQDNMGDWEHTGMVQHREDGSHAGSSPAKLWGTLIGQGAKEVIKKTAKTGGAMYAGKYLGDEYDVKTEEDPNKGFVEKAGEVAWDNSFGFLFDALDLAGELTGGWESRSINYPWGSKDRKNWMGK